MCAEPISSKETYDNENWANLVLEALPNPLIQCMSLSPIQCLTTWMPQRFRVDVFEKDVDFL